LSIDLSLAELGVKVIKMGDYSHRNYVEVEVIKPDIIGKYEKLVDKLFKAFEKNDLEKAGLAKIVQVSSEAINSSTHICVKFLRLKCKVQNGCMNKPKNTAMFFYNPGILLFFLLPPTFQGIELFLGIVQGV
jgi:hypothetical protein